MKKAGDGIRTHDSHVGNVTLYQLSYTRLSLIILYRHGSGFQEKKCNNRTYGGDVFQP
jgi:hypothetical protein